MDEDLQREYLSPAGYLLYLACTLAWREERSNGLNGMMGVLFVLRNRVKKEFFGGSLYKNIIQHGQFSSMTIVGDSQTVAYPDPADPTFQKLMSMAPSILSGANEGDITAGALYYADLGSPAYVKGGWFDKTIVNSSQHERTAAIGSTLYFN